MAKIIDADGKSWSLACRTDSMGRVYARAYRNAWDPVKRRSFVEARIQIGRVHVKHQRFWEEMELLPRGQYNGDYKQHESKNIFRSDDTIRYGVTWAGWEVLRRNQILSDLEDVSGVQDGKLIAALALYKLDGHNAMMTFEDWVPLVWLPSICPYPDSGFRNYFGTDWCRQGR